jgi:putative ABC transport system permease protein
VSRYHLLVRNIAGNAFRSSVVALCALLVASLALGATVILRGAETSLQLVNERLGADILVVPEGTEAQVEGALLLGNTTRVWMPESVLDQIAALPGVEVASPQIYLSTLINASCCSVSDMFLVAFDPKTDFAIEPWLEERVGKGLDLGEVVGGRYVFVPEGEQFIQLYGYHVTLRAIMEPTGTALDQSMFMTLDTAREIALVSRTKAIAPLEIPENSISAVMVRLEPGYDPPATAVEIMQHVPGVTPIPSLDLFHSYRQEVMGLRAAVAGAMGLTLVVSIGLMSLVFSMAANERRRELGVLRAMGASRFFVFQWLFGEAALLALAGGVSGIALTILGTYLFRNLLVNSLGLPFLLPDPLSLVVQISAGLALALVSIGVAAFVPAFRISHLDPSVAMRE